MAVKMLMKGAVLPGNSTVELKDFEIPVPGHGQVLIQTKATPSVAAISGVFTGNIQGKDRKAIFPVWLPDMSPAVLLWKKEKA